MIKYFVCNKDDNAAYALTSYRGSYLEFQINSDFDRGFDEIYMAKSLIADIAYFKGSDFADRLRILKVKSSVEILGEI